MFIDRRRGRDDKHVRWKAAFLIGGMALILLADRLEADWLIWVAIGALLVAFVLRFVPEHWTDRRTRESQDQEG